MKRFGLTLLAVIASIPIFAQEKYVLPAKYSMTKAIREVVAGYKDGSPEKTQRAGEILLSIYDDMEKDSEKTNYGCWGWVKGGPNKDRNMPLFAAPYHFVQLWPLQDRMTPAVRYQFLKTCHIIANAAERRFDDERFSEGRSEIEYTNAFCMMVETLTMAAERFGDERLRKKAATQWHRLYQYYKVHAFGEFMSTHYDEVDFCSILNISKFTPSEQIKQQAKWILDEMYVTESAGSHPVLKMTMTGASRDYRDFLKKGDARCKILQKVPAGYTVPQEALRYENSRKYPFTFEGKAGIHTYTFKSYQLKDAGMGSMTGWGNYFWQQLYLVAASGNNENERAAMFWPGCNNPVNAYTDQKEMTSLIVFNHFPSLWHLNQEKTSPEAVRKSQDSIGFGITEDMKEVSNEDGHIVFNAYGYDYHVFPFTIENWTAVPAHLARVHRENISASKRYHQKKKVFDEYVFKSADPDWVGAIVKVVKAGTKVKTPAVSYSDNGNLVTFDCKKEGLQVKVGRTESGVWITVPKEELVLMPRRRFNQ